MIWYVAKQIKFKHAQVKRQCVVFISAMQTALGVLLFPGPIQAVDFLKNIEHVNEFFYHGILTNAEILTHTNMSRMVSSHIQFVLSNQCLPNGAQMAVSFAQLGIQESIWIHKEKHNSRLNGVGIGYLRTNCCKIIKDKIKNEKAE